jgi:hypothetical protein
MATHELHSSPDTCHWGYFDSQLKPSLHIKSGDIATIHCLRRRLTCCRSIARFWAS